MNKLTDLIAQSRQLKAPRGVSGPVDQIAWERAVGTRIAKRTSPEGVERKVLYVRTATAAWANELAMLSQSIIAALAEQGVKIDALRFKVGHVEHAPLHKRPARHAPARDAPLPPALAEHIARLDADDLSAAIGKAAALSLAAQVEAKKNG
jgi:hypothetical protein